MTHQAIYKERLIPHMVVDALNRYDDHPCLHLGGETATYLEVRKQVSPLCPSAAGNADSDR